MKPPITFDTPRLKLRLPTMDDAEAIFIGYARDPEVTKYLSWSPHRDIHVTKEFLRRCIQVWEEGTAFPWVIERKEDNTLLGMVELRINEHRAELGYVLARPYWSQGYTPEAVKTIVEWALTQPTLYRVWAICDVENLASARVLEKVGMQREGILRRFMTHPGVSEKPGDCYCYSVVK